MDPNTKLLESIYESTVMGKTALGRLIKHCEDANLRQSMADMFAEYHEIQDEAEKLLKAANLAPSTPPRSPLKAHISLNLHIDKTSTHMAEMLMHGSLLGIIDLARDIRECEGANQETTALANKLLASEENNLKRLQKFL